MATIKGPIELKGSLSNISFYTRRGSDKVIARTKGGASKEKIKQSPKFEKLRVQHKEWKGCTGFASALRNAFGGLHRLADYNITPVLNGLAKELQKSDSVHPVGERAIYLSKFKHTLDNFQLNRKFPFNTIVRVLPEVNIETGTVTVTFPRFNAATDIYNLQKLPFFRLIVAMGIVSDVAYNDEEKMFLPQKQELHGISEVVTGEWINTSAVVEEHTFNFPLDTETRANLQEHCTLIVSAGIEFGRLTMLNNPEAVKYAGCARVLKVG